MINLNAYFSSGSSYSSKEFLIFYTLFIWLLVIINLTILIKVWRSNASGESNKSNLMTILIWLNVWLLGEVCLTNVQLFSNLTVIVFADIDNIFIPFGLSLSILYFSKYMQTQLSINKYSKRINAISGQIITVTFYMTFMALLILLGRFLLLPFFTSEGKSEVDTITEVVTLLLAIIVLILLILALYQLQHERNFISSKVEKYRVKYYEYFIISLLISLVFIILNLATGFIEMPKIINDLIAIPVYLGSTTGILSLYLAYTMPDWLQKRAGLLVSFGDL